MGIGCQTHPYNNDDGQDEGIEPLIQEWKAQRCQFQNKCYRKRSQNPINCPFGCCFIPKQTHDKNSKYTRTDQPRILLDILEYLGHRTQLGCNQNSYDQCNSRDDTTGIDRLLIGSVLVEIRSEDRKSVV